MISTVTYAIKLRQILISRHGLGSFAGQEVHKASGHGLLVIMMKHVVRSP